MSNSLHNLTNEYLFLVNSDDVEDELNNLFDSIENKAVNVAKAHFTMSDQLDAIRKEQERLKTLEIQTLRKQVKFEKYLLNNMERIQVNQIVRDLVSIGIKKGSYRVEVQDMNKIPDEFLIAKSSMDVNKKAAAEVLKDGRTINGLKYVKQPNKITIKRGI